MTTTPPFNHRRIYVGASLAAWLVYAGLTLLAPVHPNAYHLGHAQINLIQFTIVVPILLIWLVAANGAARLQQYTRLIAGSPDGQAFQLISAGITTMAASFIIQSLLGAVAPYMVGSSGLLALVFLRNHTPVVLTFAAFVLIYIGSLRLNISAAHKLSPERTVIVLFPYIILAGLFAAFFYQNFHHVVTNGVPNYAIPGRLPFYAVALPYCVTWLIGITAIVTIAEYARFVSGSIYRRALSNLARGLSSVMLFSILIQLVAVSNTFVAHLPVGSVLLLIYALLLLYATGFVLIDRGSRKLIRIEDIT